MISLMGIVSKQSYREFLKFFKSKRLLYIPCNVNRSSKKQLVCICSTRGIAVYVLGLVLTVTIIDNYIKL